MRIVVALGGNALLRRGAADDRREPARERARRGRAARARSPRSNELVISHGNGPQVGLLALQAAAYERGRGLPARRPGRPDRGHDRLHDRAGAGQPAAVRAAVRQHPDDGRGRPGRPGVRRPDQVHRPGLRREEAERARRREGLGRSSPTATSGGAWSPPRCPSGSSRSGRSRWLLEQGAVVDLHRRRRHPDDVRAGHAHPRRRRGRDRQGPRERAARRASSSADLFVMATDVDAVYLDWGTPEQRAIGHHDAGRARGAVAPGGLDGAQGGGGRRVRPADRASGRRSARWPSCSGVVAWHARNARCEPDAGR